MQKATIFTIFFSILVVTLVAQLLTNDHLRSGWTSVVPSGGSAVADSNGTSNAQGSFIPPVTEPTTTPTPSPDTTSAPVVPSPITTSPAPATGSTSTPTSPNEVAQFVASTSYRLEGVTDAQLKGFGFENMRLERVSADGLLFQLIDVTDIVNLSKIRFNLTDGKNVYGVLTEFMLADETKAGNFYGILKQKGSAFAPDIKLNETNSFGVHSFYMNDSKRLGTAFLAVLSGNRVFTFSYPKASQEFFKKVINLLANQK